MSSGYKFKNEILLSIGRQHRHHLLPVITVDAEALAGMKPVSGPPAAYICQNFTYQALVPTAEGLEKVLGK